MWTYGIVKTWKLGYKDVYYIPPFLLQLAAIKAVKRVSSSLCCARIRTDQSHHSYYELHAQEKKKLRKHAIFQLF